MEAEQKELVEVQSRLLELSTKYAEFEKIHLGELQQLEQVYNADIAEISNEIRLIKQQIEILRKQEAEYNQTVLDLNTQINKINLEKKSIYR